MQCCFNNGVPPFLELIKTINTLGKYRNELSVCSSVNTLVSFDSFIIISFFGKIELFKNIFNSRARYALCEDQLPTKVPSWFHHPLGENRNFRRCYRVTTRVRFKFHNLQ